MAKTLNGSISVQLITLLQNTIGVAAAQASMSPFGQQNSMSSGVGANQWDTVYSEASKSLAGNYDLDLSGALTDGIGLPAVFARVKAIVAIADPTNTGNVLIGAAGAAQFFTFLGSATDKVTLRPGGIFAVFAPDATAYLVTATTADILRFAPSAGTQLVSFAIVGASA